MASLDSELFLPPAPPELTATTPAPRSLIDVLAETVARHGDAPAIEAADGPLTYYELAAAAERLARRLSAGGVGPGDYVGVRIASGSADLYIGILGVLIAGAAYVPIDADSSERRACDAWKAASVCAVVGDGLAIDRCGGGAGAGRLAAPDDDAWVIFTSGSTGTPKAVAVSHRSATAFVDAEAELWSVGPGDRVLAGLSVGFDASCEEMWLAWRNGATLVPAPRALVRSGADLGPWLHRRRVTVVSTVPTLAAMWEDGDLEHVRLLVLGGEACSASLGWRLASRREVWNTYGPTEATVVTTAARVLPGQPVTIGVPLAGWKVAVVTAAGDPVAPGEEGELVIAGVGLGRYLDPELDQACFAPLEALGWPRAYRSGDIVRESSRGLLFVGRRDGQIKLGGRRVELGEVEACLAEAPGVRAAAAALQTTTAGNGVLVAYIVGEAAGADVLEAIRDRLPEGIVPLIVPLAELPRCASGKVDRRSLPWPPPVRRSTTVSGELEAPPLRGWTATEAWLAERWADQLGTLEFDPGSDFFALGGNSLSAAKLVSRLREWFPCVAVADLYRHPTLGELAARLDTLSRSSGFEQTQGSTDWRPFDAARLLSVLALIALSAPRWLIAAFAINDWQHGPAPRVAWLWLVVAWLVFASVPGKAALVLIARRLCLPGLSPGRYAKQSWLSCRLLFVDRLAEVFRLAPAAGTPFAATYARASGVTVGEQVHIGTLPPPTGLIHVGRGASIEANVDFHTWRLEGDELIVGEIRIGAGARIGARATLLPGAFVGEGAEVEPGSLVEGEVPAGERWAGSPARKVGRAGADWPADAPPRAEAGRLSSALYAVGFGLQSLLPLLAALPATAAFGLLRPVGHGLSGETHTVLVYAPLLAASFLVSYALLVAISVRLLSRLVRPGWYPHESRPRWALWCVETLFDSSKLALFPLYMSLCTRPWMRLAGVRVGRRTELSHAVGLSSLVSLGETSFAADDVTFATTRTRDGWFQVAGIEVGDTSFLGNGAIVPGGSTVGDETLVGVLTSAPCPCPDGTSWFGCPALELPRVPEALDPARTTQPPRRLVAARAATELVRILLPTTLSLILAAFVYLLLVKVASGAGIAVAVLASPFILGAAGLGALGLTIAAKWLLIGRYRPGDWPFWSFFVWRDEIINSLQEQLAGVWLLNYALATPLMSGYLRAMGARVGAGVWCETLNVTEFDLVHLAEGSVINRRAHIETHLVHDRLMRLGGTRIGRGATLGPGSAVLPDSSLGAGCSVGGRSVVMRGERLPAGTQWRGIPVSPP